MFWYPVVSAESAAVPMAVSLPESLATTSGGCAACAVPAIAAIAAARRILRIESAVLVPVGICERVFIPTLLLTATQEALIRKSLAELQVELDPANFLGDPPLDRGECECDRGGFARHARPPVGDVETAERTPERERVAPASFQADVVGIP